VCVCDAPLSYILDLSRVGMSVSVSVSGVCVKVRVL